MTRELGVHCYDRVASDDEHAIKVAYSAREEAAAWQDDEPYRACGRVSLSTGDIYARSGERARDVGSVSWIRGKLPTSLTGTVRKLPRLARRNAVMAITRTATTIPRTRSPNTSAPQLTALGRTNRRWTSRQRPGMDVGPVWSLQPCVQTNQCTPTVARSDTTGKTWVPTAALHPGFGPSALVATTSDTAYVLEPSDSGTELAVTHDSGASWSFTPGPCTASRAFSLNMASNGRVLMVVCGSQPATSQQLRDIFTTTDDGNNWQQQFSGAGAGRPAFLSAVRDTFVLGEARGNIRYSTDAGATWQVGIDTTEAAPSADAVPSVGIFVATGHAFKNAGLWYSPDGIHWEQRASSS